MVSFDFILHCFAEIIPHNARSIFFFTFIHNSNLRITALTKVFSGLPNKKTPINLNYYISKNKTFTYWFIKVTDISSNNVSLCLSTGTILNAAMTSMECNYRSQWPLCTYVSLMSESRVTEFQGSGRALGK